MGIRQKKIPSHWNYFLSIEDDMLHMSRWIEFDKANSKCYSIELARLLMVASAEVDVLAKMICKSINPKSKAKNITAYQNVIAREYPKVHRVKVELPKYGLTFTP